MIEQVQEMVHQRENELSLITKLRESQQKVVLLEREHALALEEATSEFAEQAKTLEARFADEKRVLEAKGREMMEAVQREQRRASDMALQVKQLRDREEESKIREGGLIATVKEMRSALQQADEAEATLRQEQAAMLQQAKAHFSKQYLEQKMLAAEDMRKVVAKHQHEESIARQVQEESVLAFKDEIASLQRTVAELHEEKVQQLLQANMGAGAQNSKMQNAMYVAKEHESVSMSEIMQQAALKRDLQDLQLGKEALAFKLKEVKEDLRNHKELQEKTDEALRMANTTIGTQEQQIRELREEIERVQGVANAESAANADIIRPEELAELRASLAAARDRIAMERDAGRESAYAEMAETMSALEDKVAQARDDAASNFQPIIHELIEQRDMVAQEAETLALKLQELYDENSRVVERGGNVDAEGAETNSSQGSSEAKLAEMNEVQKRADHMERAVQEATRREAEMKSEVNRMKIVLKEKQLLIERLRARVEREDKARLGSSRRNALVEELQEGLQHASAALQKISSQNERLASRLKESNGQLALMARQLDDAKAREATAHVQHREAARKAAAFIREMNAECRNRITEIKALFSNLQEMQSSCNLLRQQVSDISSFQSSIREQFASLNAAHATLTGIEAGKNSHLQQSMINSQRLLLESSRKEIAEIARKEMQEVWTLAHKDRDKDSQHDSPTVRHQMEKAHGKALREEDMMVQQSMDNASTSEATVAAAEAASIAAASAQAAATSLMDAAGHHNQDFANSIADAISKDIHDTVASSQDEIISRYLHAVEEKGAESQHPPSARKATASVKVQFVTPPPARISLTSYMSTTQELSRAVASSSSMRKRIEAVSRRNASLLHRNDSLMRRALLLSHSPRSWVDLRNQADSTMNTDLRTESHQIQGEKEEEEEEEERKGMPETQLLSPAVAQHLQDASTAAKEAVDADHSGRLGQALRLYRLACTLIEDLMKVPDAMAMASDLMHRKLGYENRCLEILRGQEEHASGGGGAAGERGCGAE